MTTEAKPLIGASSTNLLKWSTINWSSVSKHVKRLQMRIAKATREEKPGKVKALQWLLTHSFNAKLLAVKRVTQNRGKKTAGVDGELWKSPQQKMKGALSLQRCNYQPKPLRRIYIPKRNGKQRPLSIPTIKDRAMQALHLQALEPVAEVLADKNTYGFRPKRAAADAIEQCFCTLAKKHSSQWILEGDIKACFDKINHPWLIANIPMDKGILSKWLASGYMEKDIFYQTEEGTPQGGIISPTLLILTLRGLEVAARKAVNLKDKVHVIAYADDFVITGASQEVLENKVKPVVADFLKVRGLALSLEKTRITRIEEGFEFLGFNIRKYQGKLLIKPAKKSVKNFLASIREIIKVNKTSTVAELIRQLNPKILGWANYYRHVVSSCTFSYIDFQIHQAIWRWCKRRHPNRGARWVRKKYFQTHGDRHWEFFAKIQHNSSEYRKLLLTRAAAVSIKRHVKIKAEATPYDPAYADYFMERKRLQKNSRYKGKAIGQRMLCLF